MLLFVNVDLFPQIDIKFGHFSCKSLSSVAVNLEPINGLNNVLKETCLIITVLPLLISSGEAYDFAGFLTFGNIARLAYLVLFEMKGLRKWL